MHDETLHLRGSLAELQTALEQFNAGYGDQLFDSREVLRDLRDRIDGGPWAYLAPVCGTLQKLLGYVLRHGGVTESDSIEMTQELLTFVAGMLEQPVPGVAPASRVPGLQGVSGLMGTGSNFEPNSKRIKIDLGLVDESRLGEILVRLGRISSDQLTRALALQQVCRKRLGEVLMSQGLIDDGGLQLALAEQRKVTLGMASNLAADQGGLELKLTDDSYGQAG